MFQFINDNVAIKDVLLYYCKIRLNNNFKCKCPLHKDKTPSFKVYPNNSFYCWGCKVAGDSVKLVALLFGLTNYEAMVKINQDFNLGLDVGKKLTKEQLHEINENQMRVKKEKKLQSLEDEKKYHLDLVIRSIEKLCENFKPEKGKPPSKVFMSLKMEYEDLYNYRLEKYGYK